MDLSIITPVGRLDPHLPEAAFTVTRLAAALETEHPDIAIEWVLACDGTSAANVRALTATARHSVTIRVLDPAVGWHQGPAHTRNRALAASTGRLIATIDTDDRYQVPGMVNLYATLQENPAAHWAAGRITDVSPLGFPTWDGPAIAPTGPVPPGWFLDFTHTHGYPPFSPCAAIARREAIEAAGGWDTSITYARAEDLALWARLSRTHAGFWLDEQVYDYRMNPRSLTHTPCWGPKNADNPAWFTGFTEHLDNPVPGTGRYAEDLRANAALRTAEANRQAG